MKNKKTLLLILLIVLAAVFIIGNKAGSVVSELENLESDLTLIEEQVPDITQAEEIATSEAPANPSQDPQVLATDPQSVATELQQAEEPQAVATDPQSVATEPQQAEEPQAVIDENGWYYSKDDVALYIHTYGKLPGNFITKKEAEKLGWSGGSVEPYAKGKVIGGSHFGNYEGLLPDGHNYTECDIDTKGKDSRGAKRIIFSDDGLIYYTDDHYESFTLLYGNED